MSSSGVDSNSVGAQLDDKQNQPKGAEEHWDSKLVPERDSNSKQPVEFDHLKRTITSPWKVREEVWSTAGY